MTDKRKQEIWQQLTDRLKQLNQLKRQPNTQQVAALIQDSDLTQAQKDAYYAGKGLPKNFVKTYTPQQWNQTQVLGANDQRLFNQSQATQLGLSDMALTGLDKVNG